MVVNKLVTGKQEPGFLIQQPGPRTLLQDMGRYGYHQLGITTGGPADPFAFKWANRLCGNELNTTALEVSIGGLVMECQAQTQIAICGASVPLTINGEIAELWRSHNLNIGDRVELGFAEKGVVAYLAVTNGFGVPQCFGSTATVVREGLGGLNGGKLEAGDFLPCSNARERHSVSSHYDSKLLKGLQLPKCLKLPEGYRPVYSRHAMLRVIPGYQYHDFSLDQRQRFFNHQYSVSVQSDRMGYRLEGAAISAEVEGVLSEGICLGAIQLPPDGQPIILMHDRQTIGGYPKIGSVLSLDLGQLAQLKPGDRVYFEMITVDEAHKILHLAEKAFNQIEPEYC